MKNRAALAMTLLLTACQSASETGVRLIVSFDSNIVVDQLRLTVATTSADAAGPVTRLVPESPGQALPSGTRVLVLIADDWGARTVEFEVDGLASGVLLATGKANVIAQRGAYIDLPVLLTKLSCVNACLADVRQCIGDSLRVCRIGADGCTAWEPPQACPLEAPLCSHGQCATTCQDECASVDQKRCSDKGYQVCGKYGAGGCLSWGGVLGCADQELCQNGECVPDCGGTPCACKPGESAVCADQGECHDGQRSCGDNGTFGPCQWAIGPTNEICDGKDNDCSGTPDDFLVPPACDKQLGVCKGAVKKCGGTAGWLACTDSDYQALAQSQGLTYEAVETLCDGKDNDCNAKTDESAACCQPSCAGKACGADDGCGTKCQSGSCGANATCQSGACVCSFAPCGSSCCASGEGCQAGTCITITSGFVLIPAGSFSMGSPTSEPCRDTDEELHSVTLTHDFEMQATEVTRAQFENLMGYMPSSSTSCGSTCPVDYVRWHDAAAYCNALSAQNSLSRCYKCTGTGLSAICTEATAYSGAQIYRCPGYRLPTEAEWEYAYRAGTTTAYYNGANDPAVCDSTDATADAIGWYDKNSNGVLQPTGQKLKNAWGLFDMAGNVYEWSHDSWSDMLGTSPAVDPVSSFSGNFWVVRGGAVDNAARYLRAANRAKAYPTAGTAKLGFRVVRSR